MRDALAKRRVRQSAIAMLLFSVVSVTSAQVTPEWPNGYEPQALPDCTDGGGRGICFDFEGTEELLWSSPDWARTEGGYSAARLSRSTERAFLNDSSLQMDVWYLDDRWSAAVIALPVEMSLTGYRRMSARLFLPRDAVAAGLEARLVIVAGRWLWFETLESVLLEPGKWVTLQASLEPGRARDTWSIAKGGAALAGSLGDVRSIVLRVESRREGGVVREGYSGTLLVDDIRIER